MMEIIPAIDLKDGQCVRLYQGDFTQVTVYDADPAAAARRWAELGATRLHVVDLDGAKAGRPINTTAIRAIVEAVTIPVQVGGGLRDAAAVATALELGVARAILGTSAVQQPELVAELATRYGAAIVVGVDARDGKVATSGWTATTTVLATDLVARLAELGVQRFIYTDIARDGTLTEPNYDATQALVRPGGPAIIASGGVGRIAHLQRLATLGVEAAIVGRALYTGDVLLPDALAALQENRS